MIRFRRLFKSFIYASRGLWQVIKEEQNFKIELLAALVVMVLAWWSNFNYLEWAILAIVIGLVLLMEVVNSVVELISDVLRPKLDHYIKTIKDMVATAVMLASLLAIVVGLILFSHHWQVLWQ
ncbi:MAG: Diacylglycerol kinase [Candidatus Falkowbacteria bacterium GW2011_GWA2_39_24]|uniref:Diacylglycerol kinase n=1 Tax=Candidatus Falkowbacteria bacterium GW2011_GWA2_39_24 TaxID=1618634 RepID=A0A0G0QXY3_9BACT|nr:MAG: Diacylglycerol kinase [Candidatus Falkowbacteria bacterium GW2011_GWA2_39_24]